MTSKAELESKHLAELHALAAEAGVPRYRMLRREELIEALAGENGAAAAGPRPEVVVTGVAEAPRPPRRRRRRRFRRRRKGGPREHADRWLEAWNAHDLDAILDRLRRGDRLRLADRRRASAAARRGACSGREELRAHFARGLERAPGLAFTEEALLTGTGGYALVYRREDGARVVESVELDEHGRAIRARAFYEGS